MVEPRIQGAVDNILAIEHRKFGARVGLVSPGDDHISAKLFSDLVYSIDELAWSEKATHHKQAVQLAALAWEHASALQRECLRTLLTTSLARVGVSPSIGMLEDAHAVGEGLSPLRSYVAEVASALLQLEFSERIGSVEYVLTRFQKGVLDAVARESIIGVSAPTSAGKSFAIYLAIVRHALENDAPVIYIVPTVSLINQVSADLRRLFDTHGLTKWSVRVGLQSIEASSVYVLTQERALPGVEGRAPSERIGILVVDEVQNLERVQDENDLRAKVLYDALRELREPASDAKIILSGPRVNNIGELGRSIFGVSGWEARTDQSPVANLTYGVSRRDTGFYLTQYSDFYRTGRSLRIEHSEHISGLGQSRYTDGFMDYLRLVVEGGAVRSSTIVFAPTSSQARKTAVSLSKLRAAPDVPRLEELAEYISDTIHPKYELADSVRKGIGFHSGRVPPHARLAVEQAFSDGLLSEIVCTTTLMQGVNLPANLVVVRNPQLFINRRAGRENPHLSPYEFANLRGRAGRLLKDFVGRTLVLDEDSFLVESGQEDLFPDAGKTVSAGYKDLFSRNRSSVEADLATPGVADSGAAKFLATYIRQTLLRHGDAASRRLQEVGIELSGGLVQSARRALSELDVPHDVLLGNRYWDPMDLQDIKDNMAGGVLTSLPDEPWTASPKVLEDWLKFQLRVAPHYAQRYIRDVSAERVRTLSISAVEWARERPLNEIIRKRHFTGDVSGKVEQQVTDLQRYVVYGIPALLKPVADLQGSGHGFLAAIESGAFSPVTRLLMDQGLYRETAVHVQRKVLSGVSGQGESLLRAVAGRLRDVDRLGFWVRRQVEPVVDQLRRRSENVSG